MTHGTSSSAETVLPPLRRRHCDVKVVCCSSSRSITAVVCVVFLSLLWPCMRVLVPSVLAELFVFIAGLMLSVASFAGVHLIMSSCCRVSSLWSVARPSNNCISPVRAHRHDITVTATPGCRRNAGLVTGGDTDVLGCTAASTCLQHERPLSFSPKVTFN